MFRQVSRLALGLCALVQNSEGCAESTDMLIRSVRKLVVYPPFTETPKVPIMMASSTSKMWGPVFLSNLTSKGVSGIP